MDRLDERDNWRGWENFEEDRREYYEKGGRRVGEGWEKFT